MRKLMLAVALALVPMLGGCAQIHKAETFFTAVTGKIVTPQQVIIAANAFDAVKATATNYLRLPRCPAAQVCRTPSTTPKIVSAIKAGTSARNQLEAALRANPGANLTLVDVYNALRDATSRLAALVGQ